jgi:hypothetical protein
MSTLHNWTPYYKIDPTENRLVRSNMLYTPLINPEGNIFCMNWDYLNEYQTKHGPRDDFDEELIDFFFEKEIKYLTIFSRYKWSPRLIDIDIVNKQIFFEWPGETCNNIIYTGRSLNDHCVDWQQQLHNIVTDIVDTGYYKLSLYPHCHFIQDGILRSFDFYGCVEIDNPYVELDKIKGMVGPNSQGRFDEAVVNGVVNLNILFKRALEKYIVWPDNSLQQLYKKLSTLQTQL